MKKILMTLVAGSVIGTVAHAQDAKPAPSWTDKVTLKGDMRFRFESIDAEDRDTRERGRVRARIGADARAGDDLDIGIRLSTGQDNDPVSSNQTLDEGFSRKDVLLDLAYLDWHPGAVEGLDLVFGKMEMPFVTIRDLVFDGDLNPEGIALKYKGGEDTSFHVNAGGFWVDERSSADETMLYGGQVAVKHKMEDAHVLIGGGMFYYDNIEGFAPVFDAEDSFGNSTITLDEGTEDESLVYANGYEIANVFGEVGMNVGVPASLYGDYAVNQDADDNDTGFMVGLKLGKTKEPGSFDLDYNYRDLEADAVLGAFTDSDSFGGGTDGEGHKVAVGYQISKALKGQVSYFMQEAGTSGDGKDYDRLQVDLLGKF